jgi:hypothetical protein
MCYLKMFDFRQKNSLKIYFIPPKLTGNLLLCNNYIDQLNFNKKKTHLGDFG